MKKLVVANWKMNPKSEQEALDLAKDLDHKLKAGETRTETAICPPFVFLPALAKHRKNFSLGVQNISWQDKGSLTGEVSAAQLKEYGVQYVILGHSERRLNMGETDSVVNAKLIEALKHKLTPILCLGGEEGAIENEMKTLVTKQFIRCTKDIDLEDLTKIVYAYEPIWAISTMKNSRPASGEHARDLVEHVYMLLEHRLTAKKARSVKVLYGGTVNKDNVHEYAKYPEICGALVGAASLDAENIWKVVEEFERESVHKL
jgi:triosephosphate isomerase